MKVTIYALCDPICCKIRYIGRTKKVDIRHRLIEHISKSKYHNVYYPNVKASHKVNWINSLLKKGVEPVIKKLCVVEGWLESYEEEKRLISKYASKRDLTNFLDCGPGNYKSRSKEEREKISNSLKIYYKTNKNSRAKEINVYDLNGNFLSSYKSATDFAKVLGVLPRAVTRVAAGEYGRKTIKGYVVKYIT